MLHPPFRQLTEAFRSPNLGTILCECLSVEHVDLKQDVNRAQIQSRLPFLRAWWTSGPTFSDFVMRKNTWISL